MDLIHMGNPGSVAREFGALEARHMSALELMREGLNNSQIGREVGGRHPDREPLVQRVQRRRQEGAVTSGPRRTQAAAGRQTKQIVEEQ
jgi:hypothetical protein